MPVTLIRLALKAPLVVLPNMTALPVVAVPAKVMVPLFAVSGALYQPTPLIPFESTHPFKPVALIVTPPLAEVTAAWSNTEEFPLLVMPLIVMVLFAYSALLISAP